MDTLSFVLGIAFVVVIAVAVVAVYAFVKVKKIRKDLDEVIRRIDFNDSRVYRDLGDIRETIYRDMESRHDSLVAIMDSRMDRLENKLTAKSTYTKQLLKD
jgi:uncharacterized protein (DUF885 family)